MGYCVDSDLYDYGVPRGGLPNPGRMVSSVNATSNVLTLDGHGFALNDELLFRAEGGGSLPGGLSTGTTYYAKPLTGSTFQVAASAGGAAIDLSSAGSNVIVVTPLPTAKCITWASALIEQYLPAHVVPLDSPYPAIVVALTAELAAAKLLAYCGSASQLNISDRIAAAQKLLDGWLKSRPLRGTNAPSTTSLAVKNTVVSARDPRGWIPTHGGLP